MRQKDAVWVGDVTGIFVRSLQREKHRGEPISEVVILSPEGYTELQRVQHGPTVEQGIQRQVCLVAEDGLEVALAEADVLLKKAAERSDRVILSILGAPPTDAGETIHLWDNHFGRQENLLATAIDYHLSGRGEWCRIECVEGTLDA